MKLRTLCLAAALATALPASAYERSEAAPGVGLYWATRDLPVPVLADLNSGPTGAGCSGGTTQVAELIDASLGEWTKPSCTAFAFDYRGQATNTDVGFVNGGTNQNIIVFRRGSCAADPRCTAWNDDEICANEIGCWPHDDLGPETIALTTTTYVSEGPSIGRIVDADMELNDKSADGGYAYTCPASGPFCANGVPDGSCVATDLGSILTHEAGHMLGLDHPAVPGATMYASYSGGSTGMRSLDPDDEAGVCAIYPSGNNGGNNGGSSSSDGGGCSTGPAGLLSLLAAGLWLRRLRARG